VLYRLVTEYADLGDHRTGTPVDESTAKWFAAQLTSRGAAAELQEYSFDRYDVRSKVTIDGQEVAAWPLYYEGVGQVTTNKPYVGSLDVSAAGAPGLDALLADARRAKAPALVVATSGADGRLIALNRQPVLGQGPPTLFVAGALADRLIKGKVTVDFEAAIKPGRSANVIARFGGGTTPAPLLIATPLAGWFKCAGEHGTAVAVTLEVASAISKLAPVLVVGTTGTELGALGLRHYLRHSPPRPQAILHLGASLAAGRKEKNRMVLSDRLYVDTSLSPVRHNQLNQAFRPLGLKFTYTAGKEAKNPERWHGEARLWCRLGVTLLAVAGPFPLFHTPDDLPALATSPALLADVCRAMTDAARLLAEK